MFNDDQIVHANYWWKLGGLSGWGAAGALAVSMAVMYCHRLPPYVLEVNADMQPIGVIQPVESLRAITDPLLRGWIGQFIHDAFSVDQSPDEEETLRAHTAARVTGQAHDALQQWYGRDKGAHDPATVYFKEWTEVHVLATVKTAAPGEYEAVYETVTHHQGDDRPEQVRWHANIHLTTAASDDPLSTGVFADSLNFAQEQQ